MDDLKILQVVGYKNSGKTTLIEGWLSQIAEKQLRAAVIKHHGHGGPLDMPPASVDSMKYLVAGAVCSISCSKDMVQLHVQVQPDMNSLIEMAARAHPDVILVEGFKHVDQPKVVIVRLQQEWESLRMLTNIRLVLVHSGVEVHDRNRTILKITEVDVIERWLIQYIEGE